MNPRPDRRHRRAVLTFVAGAATTALLAGGVAVAAIPSTATGAVAACVNARTGAVRFVDTQARQRCARGERPVAIAPGVTHRGTWSARATYQSGNVVLHSGGSYLAKASSRRKTPRHQPGLALRPQRRRAAGVERRTEAARDRARGTGRAPATVTVSIPDTGSARVTRPTYGRPGRRCRRVGRRVGHRGLGRPGDVHHGVRRADPERGELAAADVDPPAITTTGRPAASAAAATPLTTLPRSDCQSKAPSPVTTTSAAAIRPARPTVSITVAIPGTPGTDSQQRIPEPARGPRPERDRGVRAAGASSDERRPVRQRALQPHDLGVVGPLLRGEAVRGAAQAEQRVVHVGRGHQLDRRPRLTHRGEVDRDQAAQGLSSAYQPGVRVGAVRAGRPRAHRGQHARAAVVGP